MVKRSAVLAGTGLAFFIYGLQSIFNDHLGRVFTFDETSRLTATAEYLRTYQSGDPTTLLASVGQTISQVHEGRAVDRLNKLEEKIGLTQSAVSGMEDKSLSVPLVMRLASDLQECIAEDGHSYWDIAKTGGIYLACVGFFAGAFFSKNKTEDRW